MPTLLVVSTSPGAGKTAFAATYAARLLADGAAVSLGKAFGAAEDADVLALNTLVDGAKAIDPITVSGNPTDDQVKQVAQAAGGSDASAITVIEGLSGNHAVNRSLADELDASVVLVSGQSDFKSAIQAAPVYGDRLAGVVINNAPRHRGHDLDTEVVPALEVAGLPYIGVIPEDRRLVAVTARAMNECLGGEWLEWEEHADELVENVLIGGIVLDWGPLYFASQENAAVLVRGDRPDLAIAALATPIKALILTCGVQPVEYVYYEADKRQVPVTVVKSDTQQAATELERFLEFSHFDHPAKLERFSELASEHLDLDRIDSAIARPVTG
jgi:BioD-like phosphotransacetylase family protein